MTRTVRARRILPVVHLLDPPQAVAQARLALRAGADGVFLIDHGGDVENTRRCLDSVRAAEPEGWVGVNLLSQPLTTALVTVSKWSVDALWSDDAGLDERLPAGDQPAGLALQRAVEEHGFLGEVFGGVAFKYQRRVTDEDLAAAAAVGSRWLDVVTTSGPGTGTGASWEKLEAMRSGMAEGARLAVASGVNAETVARVLTLVDDVLVASSVCVDFHSFDPRLLEALIAAADPRAEQPF